MSSDKQDRRRPAPEPSEMVDEPRALVVDSTDADVKATPNVRRRREGVVAGQTGPLTGFDKYIPEGCVPKWVEENLGQTTEHYDDGWEYAVDSNGDHIRHIMNRDPRAKEQYNTLMYIPKEFFNEDQEELRRQREALVKGSQVHDPTVDNHAFFNELGLRRINPDKF